MPDNDDYLERLTKTEADTRRNEGDLDPRTYLHDDYGYTALRPGWRWCPGCGGQGTITRDVMHGGDHDTVDDSALP